jgi:hypothetical protein
VGALYGFVRAAFGPTEAAIAAWLLAVHPAAIEYTGDIQSEGLYLALFLAAAWALWVGLRDRRPGPALLGGALSGAAYLTRPEGLGIAVVAGGIAALRLLRGRFAVRAALVWGLALAVGVLALAGPYLVWLRIEEGHWTFSGKKSLEVVAGLEEAPREGRDPLAPAPVPEPGPQGPPASGQAPPGGDDASAPGGVPSADATVLEEELPPPPSRPAQIGAALGDVLRTHRRALRYELLPLLLAGWLLAGRPRPGERGAFVLGAVGFHFLVLFGLAANVGYVSGRHAFPPLTLTFGHAALGLRLLAGYLGGGSPRRRSAMAALLLLVVTGIGLGKALRPDRLDGLAERRAAEWLGAQPLEVDAVAARKRRTAYYADAPWVKLASAAFPAGLRELGASHLILTDEDRPEYAKLGPLEPPEARLLHSVRAGGQTAFIYDLEPWRRPASQTP